MDVHVTQVPWSSHADRLRQVRERVFIEEQAVPRDEEWDGLDDSATHFLALNSAGQPLGCARLLPDGRIGRMAVLKEHRGTGLGRRLLQAAIDEGIRQRMLRVSLHAQLQAAGFYRKAGFVAQGPEFTEAGIPHVAMTLELPIPFERIPEVAPAEVRPEPAAAPDDPPRLVADSGENACAAGLLECLARPRRQLVLLSPLLDPFLFDRPEVADALSQFVRSARAARVQILIRDSTLIVARGHRLIELARRLDSRIEIRKLPEDAGTRELSFATWDNRGYWMLPDYREHQGLRNFYDPVQAERLSDQFARLWVRSAPDPELRLLRL